MFKAILIFCSISCIYIATSKETDPNEFNNFSLNFGAGTSLIQGTKIDPELCFHGGFDYILSPKLDMVGFRYFIFFSSYLEYSYINSGQYYRNEGKINHNAYYLYYRFPFDSFTLAIGPGLYEGRNKIYFTPGITLGYQISINNTLGFELAGTTLYNEMDYNHFYIFLCGGLRVHF